MNFSYQGRMLFRQRSEQTPVTFLVGKTVSDSKGLDCFGLRASAYHTSEVVSTNQRWTHVNLLCDVLKRQGIAA